MAKGSHQGGLKMLLHESGASVLKPREESKREMKSVAYHVRLSLTAGALVEVAEAVLVPEALVLEPVPVEVVGVPATGFWTSCAKVSNCSFRVLKSHESEVHPPCKSP